MRLPVQIAVFFFLLLMNVGPTRAYEKELTGLTSELSEQVRAANRNTLAVVDFTDLQGNVTLLGRFLAEELSIGLAGTESGLKIIDRIHLSSILREHELSESGLIDPKTARKLGNIVGAEAILTGSITPFGDTVRLAVKVLETESAIILGSAHSNIPKTGAIDELLAQGVSEAYTTMAAPEHPTEPSNASTVANEFAFRLLDCRFVSEKVNCGVLVTNLGEDRRVELTPDSRITDQNGNESRVLNMSIGSREWSKRPWNSVQNELVSRIPTKIWLSFQMDDDAQWFSLLELRFKTFNAQLKNIPLQR